MYMYVYDCSCIQVHIHVDFDSREACSGEDREKLFEFLMSVQAFARSKIFPTGYSMLINARIFCLFVTSGRFTMSGTDREQVFMFFVAKPKVSQHMHHVF